MASPRTTRVKYSTETTGLTTSEPKVKEDAEICAACFPDGWPELTVGASCEHGHYSREDD